MEHRCDTFVFEATNNVGRSGLRRRVLRSHRVLGRRRRRHDYRTNYHRTARRP